MNTIPGLNRMDVTHSWTFNTLQWFHQTSTLAPGNGMDLNVLPDRPNQRFDVIHDDDQKNPRIVKNDLARLF